jgi:hypothetical protein
MNPKRITGPLALITAIAAVAGPVATAGAASDPGLVARKLGSPDPRENVTKTQYAPGIVASRLGSPDPRETSLASTAPSAVASTLGSPDPQEAARVAQTEQVQVGRGFDWGDFGIGLAFGIGLSAILAGSAILATVALRGRSVAQRLA